MAVLKTLFAVALASVLMFAASTATAQENTSAKSSAETAAAIADAVKPGLVRVEMTLRYDNSESPYGGGTMEQCPSCGQFHVSITDGLVEEERPADFFGYLLAPDVVLTSDPLMHARFIKSIDVRRGKEVISAQPLWRARGGNMMALKLDRALRDAIPYTFDSKQSAPYFAVTYTRSNGTYLVGVEAISSTVVLDETGRRYTTAPQNALIVDKTGVPVGVSLTGELPLDGSWKGSPMEWPKIHEETLVEAIKEFERKANGVLPRVALRFRSPKSDESDYSYYYSEGDEPTTEWNGSGVMLDQRRVLVLANLKPDVTARLDDIELHWPDGTTAHGEFVATLKDYGAFVAELDELQSMAALAADGDIRTNRNAMLFGAEVIVQGTQRIAYHTHTRIASFEIGWKGRVYPELAGEPEFLFTMDGKLLAIPMQRREKVTVQDDWSHGGDSLIPASYVFAATTDLEANSDPTNRPLSEEEENRIAWMGVELQALDAELARAHNISQQTNDGETGAIVTWVYKNSPAERAGLEVGDVLIRLHVVGHPKPLDVSAGYGNMYYDGGFPWEQLDQLPEEYFGQIPAPWPKVKSEMNKKLMQLGFGTSYEAEVVRGDETLMIPLDVVESPAHYDSAPQYKNDALGITVRDVTYEVRRYLQRDDDDPGVVISMIEPGSKASIAGIKPFELITQINDQPVMNVSDFEQLSSEPGELRLSVRRMTRGRIVKLDNDAAVDEIAVDDDGAEDVGGADDDSDMDEAPVDINDSP